jgi:hypothetical protein
VAGENLDTFRREVVSAAIDYNFWQFSCWGRRKLKTVENSIDLFLAVFF